MREDPDFTDFDLRAPGRGFVMKGWDFSSTDIQEAVSKHVLLNPAVELFSNICPWSCDFCFTESPEQMGRKLALKGELSLESRKLLLDQLRDLGAKSINIVGAGEPTIDPSFWPLTEHIARLGMTPILYTEGALKLTDKGFAQRLYDLGCTVVVKVNSLTNAKFQNMVVQGRDLGKRGRRNDYFSQRNLAIDTLLDAGFADGEPTRLAFDTIVSRQNIGEIPDLHRWARDRNIFLLLVDYLPSGRSQNGMSDQISPTEHSDLLASLAAIDRKEYGIDHPHHYPYAGGVPCTIRGLGLFVKIQGAVFDCPGEARLIGRFPETPMAHLWELARPITEAFDGGCLPRDEHRAQRNISV
jgi:molybdenum cofactor biosynthesis enzyme MoaA